VRYRALIDDRDAYLCHCRMCQRATGGVSIAFRSTKRADIVWEREPDRYASSAIAARGFCRECGTPLTFEYLQGSDQLDLTVGSFDDPRGFHPTSHFGAESLHEAWHDALDRGPGWRKRALEGLIALQRAHPELKLGEMLTGAQA
jgi:hypothetical protein